MKGKLTRASDLVLVKKVALRRGVWYRALNRLERGVIDLTVKYVDSIRSSKLATLVTAILDKLQAASESMLDRLTRSVGFLCAKKISEVAVCWGNFSAGSWVSDAGFARYLAVAHLNSGGQVS